MISGDDIIQGSHMSCQVKFKDFSRTFPGILVNSPGPFNLENYKTSVQNFKS